MKTNTFITPSETAVILELGLSATYERLREKKIPHFKCGSKYIIRREDVMSRIDVLRGKKKKEKVNDGK